MRVANVAGVGVGRLAAGPTQVGQLAAAAAVGTVVLSHYAGASADDLAAIRREFSGEVIAGEDLMRL